MELYLFYIHISSTYIQNVFVTRYVGYASCECVSRCDIEFRGCIRCKKIVRKVFADFPVQCDSAEHSTLWCIFQMNKIYIMCVFLNEDMALLRCGNSADVEVWIKFW